MAEVLLPEKLLTTDELSERLGIDKTQLSRKASRGEIPGYKIGHLWRFDWREVIEALRTNRKRKAECV